MTPLQILTFLHKNGGESYNHDLVRRFKHYLSDEVVGSENKKLLREVTSTFCCVSKRTEGSFIVLKHRYQGEEPEEILASSLSQEKHEEPAPDTPPPELPPRADRRERTRSIYEPSDDSEEAKFITPRSLTPKRPRVTARPLPPLPVEDEEGDEVIKEPEEIVDEDEAAELDDVFEAEPSSMGNTIGTLRAARKFQKSVKEQAKSFDEIAKTSQLQLRDHFAPKSDIVLNRRDVNRNSRRSLDGDRRSVDLDGDRSLNEERKAWILLCSQNKTFEILNMLQRNPSLAGFRELFNGYSVFHWMAKHGNIRVLEFLVAQRLVGDVNGRTNGGYTALMLAAQSQRGEAFDYLSGLDGVDPDLRDYSGRKARHYLKDNKADKDEDVDEERSQEGDEPDFKTLGRKQVHKARNKAERGATFLRDFMRGSARFPKGAADVRHEE